MPAPPSLAERAGVSTATRREQAAEVVKAAASLTALRLSFADQHGILRGKTFAAAEAERLLEHGAAVTAVLLNKDTGGTYAVPLWSEGGSATMNALIGARDVVMLPDPSTFRELPWSPGTGWMLCDLHTADGAGLPLSTRRLCAAACRELERAGHRLRSGLELELHLFHRRGDGPASHPVHPGWELLDESHADLVEPLLAPLQRGLAGLGLPPRSIEVELGPGQIELTFAAMDGMASADAAVLVRSAVRQMASRAGLVATFMARPVGGVVPQRMAPPPVAARPRRSQRLRVGRRRATTCSAPTSPGCSTTPARRAC